MVLSSLGFDVSEADLRHLCDCTPFGTDALKAVDAARQLGFAGTSKHNLSPTELAGLLRDGHHPIVFVDLMPIDGVREQHALVVVEMDTNFVTVLDPLRGERVLPRQEFLRGWAWQRYLVLIIKS